MSRKPVNWWLWAKLFVGGAAISVGGPMLVEYLRPTDEELRAKYNPDLLARSLDREARNEREQQFDAAVKQMKEYTKSDKNIWIAMAEVETRKKRERKLAELAAKTDAELMRAEMRKEAGLGDMTGR